MTEYALAVQLADGRIVPVTDYYTGEPRAFATREEAQRYADHYNSQWKPEPCAYMVVGS